LGLFETTKDTKAPIWDMCFR